MSNKITWKSEKRRIEELKGFEGNPRQANEKEVADLTKSLDKFDLADPLIINTDGEVIGGNFRLKLLQERGIKEVDVRVPNRTLDRKEAEELNLRLNKNSGSWDNDILANFGEEMLKDVGWENEELDKIFQLGAEEDDFDVEVELGKIKKPKVKLGELFQLGLHKLLCGDSTKKEDVEKLMGGKLARLVFTSPPYNMAGGMYENYEEKLKKEEIIKINLKIIENCKEFLKGFIFWNLSYNKNARWEFIEIFHRIIKETGLKFLEMICWDKGHALPITSKEGITRQYEDILLVGDEDSISKDLELYFLGRNDRRAYFNKKNQKGITNYWRIGTNKTQIKENLACFPVALPKKGIEMMTNRGEIVLDPFGGSGSTLIACEQLNRKCYMCEIDPIYCQIIINRWEKFSGEKAVKLN